MSAADDKLVKLPLLPEELEFFAEEEHITVIPNFEHEEDGGYIACIGDRYGPFSPNLPVEVPLWMAVHMARRGRARIMPPQWLRISALKATIEAEQRDNTGFQPLPHYWMEVACALFKRDVRSAFGEEFQEVRTLVQQLANIRRHKVEEGLAQVNAPVTVKLNHLSAYEVNTIRLSFLGTLNMFARLEEAENALAATGYTPSAY